MERYRIADDVGVYFLTMSVVDWLPVFVSQGACQILTDSLNFCHEHKGLAGQCVRDYAVAFPWDRVPPAV
jgi:hypothetical protein